jgi:hypothetical protein
VTQLISNYAHRDDPKRSKSCRRKSSPSPASTRKSERLSEPTNLSQEEAKSGKAIATPEKSETETAEEVTDQEAATSESRSTRYIPQIPVAITTKINWFESTGKELFNILSKTKSKELCFDEEYYVEQQDKHQKSIEKAINPGFLQELEDIQKTAANVSRRRELAMSEFSQTTIPDKEEDDNGEEDEFAEENLDEYMVERGVSTPEIADRIMTRSISALSSKTPVFSMRSIAIQTETLSLDECVFPKISTRVPSKVKGTEGTLIHPKVMEAIVMMDTLPGNSTSNAIYSAQIMANIVFGQSW